jgi:LysR family positive regulator for ilvC
MDLEDLRHFEHLAQSLHFAASARARGMSASALTRRIQALESEVGLPLFSRDQRRVALTDAGHTFRQFARRQVEQWEDLQNTLRSNQASPTGELGIACTVTACHTILPTLLAKFRARYPRVTLRLLTQDAARSRAQLEAGELDLAVIPTDATQLAGLYHRVLATTRLVFIAPKNLSSLGIPGLTEEALHRPSALNGLPLVAPIGGLERERLDQWLSERDVVPQIVAEVRGNEGVLAMVSLGSGIGLVPELVLTNSPLRESASVLSRLPGPRGYDVSLCARPRSLQRRVVSAFWDLTGELLPSTPAVP